MTETAEVKEAVKHDSKTMLYATGRRKSAIARVWLVPGASGFEINGRTL